MAPPSADIISGVHTGGLPTQLKQADGILRPSAAALRGNAPAKVHLPTPAESAGIASAWLERFQASLDSRDVDKVLDGFHEDAYWKDLLTLEWDHHCKKGKPAIKEWLLQEDKLFTRQIKNVKMEPGSAASLEAMPGLVWIMAFYTFETNITRGRGAIRLQQVPGSQQWKAYLFYMGIEEIIGHEEKNGRTRPQGVNHGENVGRESWLQRRKKHMEYTDGHEPEVVVVGAGQGGLTVSARLTQLGVDTLTVERNERVGDNWRKRYNFLVLHDPVWYDHLPYQPFPAHWPVFTPKDKLADWLESYAQNLELNVWCSTKLLSSSYDRAKGVWTLELERGNGEKRTLHPKFVVLASGHSGEPNRPKFKGVENFRGRICHSSEHTTGGDWRGKKAIVIGCCNSGHDIAHDFAEQGADITMVQRSSTYIMSSEAVVKLLFRDIYCEDGPPVEDCDLIFNSTPNPVHLQQMAHLTAEIADFDKETLDGLQKAGFSLAWGPNNAGFLPLYFSRGGGYYLDVGASKLIADGKIKVKQGQEIDHFDETGIVFADGSRLDADVVVCATGYQNMKTTAVKIFGDEVKDTKEVWGMDEEGELKTMWRDSGHPGFFYQGGNLALCRFFSKRLALRIKAKLLGLA